VNWLINTLWIDRTYNDVFTITLYWLPLLANAIAYSARVWQRVQKDKGAIRGDADCRYHSDWLRFGDLIGYALAVMLPLVNLTFFVFDTMGDLWKMAWHRLEWLFSIRLVPGEPPK
jgi:hypothetical protein